WLINRDISHRPEDARDALKRWPKNPDPAGEIPVAKAVIVEDTPEVSTGEIKIVTASKASAPPALIVRKGDSTPVVGSRTGRLKSGSQPIRRGAAATGPLTGTPGRSRPNVRRTNQGNGSKTKLILFGVIGLLIVGLIGFQIASSAGAKKAEERIASLASSGGADSTVADVRTALDFLSDRKSSLSVRRDSIAVLEQVEAAEADSLILDALIASGYTPLQLQLSEVLGKRGYEEAVPTIIASFRKAATDDQRLAFLGFLRPLATVEHVDLLVDALMGSFSSNVRRALEDVILTSLRKSDVPSSVVEDLLSRSSSATGDGRKSLFRLLGVLGGDKVLTRLKTIFAGSGGIDVQRDAISAYLHWKDPTVLPLVEEIIQTTSDDPLRSAAERAYARLAILPAPETREELIARWDSAFEKVGTTSDIQRLTRTVLGFPSQDALTLLRAWAKDETFGSQVQRLIQTLQKTVENVPTIQTGDSLKGNRTSAQGDGSYAIDSSVGSLTNWTSPNTWFTWSFKVGEPGDYGIEILQASLEEDPSDFEVYLGGSKLTGRSEKTDTLKDFVPIRLNGTVPLKANRIYTLVLKAGEKVQPRMM
ncbi:MAG: hypothetical protein AAF491_11430, partial [Verrucomicrobiota bacterium]